MTIQITKTISFLLPMTIILIGYFYFYFQKLKKNERKKIQFLFEKISLEKKIAFQLKNTSKEIEKTNAFLQQKITKIKIDIFNIDFTLSEIF